MNFRNIVLNVLFGTQAAKSEIWCVISRIGVLAEFVAIPFIFFGL